MSFSFVIDQFRNFFLETMSGSNIAFLDSRNNIDLFIRHKIILKLDLYISSYIQCLIYDKVNTKCYMIIKNSARHLVEDQAIRSSFQL